MANLISQDHENGEIKIGDLDKAFSGGQVFAGQGRVYIDGGSADGVFIVTSSPNGVEFQTQGHVVIRDLPTADPHQLDRLYRDGDVIKISNGPQE